MTQPLNIGVLGSGSAGRTLATGFLERGYPVMIGSRDPSKLQDWLERAGHRPGSALSQKPPSSATSSSCRSTAEPQRT
jgi:3-hydroxyisobutyrate dehydrogenase-like beta-hydroxyacid dehydrogenase